MIPALVLLVAGLLWGLMAAVARIQCVDAARAGARAAARGEPADGVARAVRSAAPPRARLHVTREGDLVRVAVRARTVGPGPLTVELRSEAVALDEAAATEDGAPGDGSVSTEDEVPEEGVADTENGAMPAGGGAAAGGPEPAPGKESRPATDGAGGGRT
ncbi:TadE family type IV pilus minor pilin [Streptomyces albus]|uniref:TadE family type IV pilus minor pilin n=1 Tax=Streptomyces albus TaxID=1888 RepID=UPI003D0FB748